MSAKGEPKLTDEMRTFVVQQLAMFDSPAQAAKALRDAFGVTIRPQSVEFYDPTKRAGDKLAEKWRTIFIETRKAFIEDTTEIGISHKTVRLRALQRMAAAAEGKGNLALAAQMHEQAAKEMGDAYTNTRVLRGGLELTAPKSLADFYGGSDT